MNKYKQLELDLEEIITEKNSSIEEENEKNNVSNTDDTYVDPNQLSLFDSLD